MMKAPRLHKLLDYVPRGAVARNAYKLARPHRYRMIEDSRAQISGEEANVAAFFRTKTIFVHIPKTAGISVVLSFYGDTISMAHTRLRMFRLLFTEEEFDSFYKFAFVRHPTDRLISAFNFLKGGGITQDDSAFADAHLAPYDDFSSFVRKWLTPASAYSYVHFVPQHDFVMIRGKPGLDYIGRFESLAEDYEHIRHATGIGEALKKYNVRNQSKTRPDLAPDVRRIIETVYEKDFELFDYQP
ncbi:sulfotransferase family 2 domain-containing protein [Hyphococcus luteus]|nr:sulfotransferase family 2 domain-containing protein [Marinicaulis flavus]